MNHKQLFVCTVVALAAMLTSGCAAMFDGTKSDVSFTTDPPGAQVTVGEQTFTTPFVGKIPKKVKTGTATHPDFPGQEVTLTWKRDFQYGYLFLDILFTPGYGLVGCLVDGGTHAWYKQPPQIAYSFTTAVASPNTVTAKVLDTSHGAPQEASSGAAATP